MNIKDSRVDDNDHHYVDGELFNKWMKEPLKAGDVLLTSEAPTGEVAYLSQDRDWCLGQRLFGLRGKAGLLEGQYLYYLLRGGEVRNQLIARATGTTVSGIRQSELVKVELDLPPLPEQQGIAATLGALDDKIESNRRARSVLRRLGGAKLLAAIAGGSCRCAALADLTLSISRGVTPKYADDDLEAPLVINQKCVRGNWVSTEPARRMVYRELAPAKFVGDGDILVNSTGTGTLGRVGRWHSGTAFADSHVSILKADPGQIGPTVLAYLLFNREADIEGMATGSTGQTELSPSRLGELVIEYPDSASSSELEELLLAIENRAAALLDEEQVLGALRDALLPELLSGRIRVPEAEQAVAGVTA